MFNMEKGAENHQTGRGGWEMETQPDLHKENSLYHVQHFILSESQTKAASYKT